MDEEHDSGAGRLHDPGVRRLEHDDLIRKLELALWAADLAWWDYDLVSRTVEIHPRKAEMIGFGRGEITQDVEFWIDRIHPEERDAAIRSMRGHIQGEYPSYDIQYRLRCKNGQYRWFRDRGRIVERDENGGATRVTGIVQDIHELKSMQDELLLTLNTYHFIAENIVDLVWIADSDTNFTYVSPSSAHITGISPEEMLEKRWEDMITPESRRRAEKVLAEISEHGPAGFEYPVRLELEQYHKEGGTVWTEVLFRVLTGQNGEITGYVGVTREIEERKRTELRLREFSKRIIAAQEAERSRISRDLHDSIGANLAALRLQAEAAVKVLPKAAADELRGKLEEIQGTATETIGELRRVINDLRPTVLDDFGLSSAIEWLCRKYSELYGLTVDMKTGFEENDFDGVLKTVLFRLAQESLYNVVRHSDVKKAELKLGRTEDIAFLEVRDRGRGFDPKNYDTGLGIIGMRERVETLGGELEIYSEKGKGTRVVARIPIGSSGQNTG
jgi:hypothetical protein